MGPWGNEVMVSTIVELPEEVAETLDRLARAEGITRSELIVRRAESVVPPPPSRPPRIPLFRSDDPTLAERVDELLEGFGED